MNWITLLKTPGHINEAIIHFNQANDMLKRGVSMVEVSRSLFDALNKIQTEWLLHNDVQNKGEVKAFQRMIVNGIDPETYIEFLKSDEVNSVVEFAPNIMNHDTLRRHGYRPDIEIEPDLVRKASKEHHKVVTAYKDFLSRRDDQTIKRVLARTAELLYVVRSNIAHGEKTPYGPDLKKRKRDQSVCETIVPLQRFLLNLLLDRPDRKLVAYGTLGPGKANYDMLSGLQGAWEECVLNGRIDKSKGLLFFTWHPGGPTIDAQLFISPILPNNWVHLDRFEGDAYRRRLAPVKRSSGISIASIYVAASNPEATRWEH
ncbi:hypothetical protein ACFL0Q_03035 [Thermodesulfobacteriota bacterium]